MCHIQHTYLVVGLQGFMNCLKVSLDGSGFLNGSTQNRYQIMIFSEHVWTGACLDFMRKLVLMQNVKDWYPFLVDPSRET